MEREKNTIPNRLRYYRKRFGYSRKQVAALLVLNSPSDVARWERGVNMPTSMSLLKLCALYRTSANDLYYDVVNELKKQVVMKESQHFGEW